VQKDFKMRYASDLSTAIGNTPLIKLRQASEETGCTILGKAEFMNPGQSVKDRAALSIIQDAVASGSLRPGGCIVEGTAGNTGIGLALIGASMGFKTVIVIPETQSQEKKDMLQLSGAELIQVPAVPYRNPNNFVRYSGRLAEALNETEPNGAIWANQFDNVANRRAHVQTTGPEIWKQTNGKVDGFICAVGSGGTLAGVAEVLQPRGVKIGLAATIPQEKLKCRVGRLQKVLVKFASQLILKVLGLISSIIYTIPMLYRSFLTCCSMRAYAWVHLRV
jgi:cysteine synthase A